MPNVRLSQRQSVVLKALRTKTMQKRPNSRAATGRMLSRLSSKPKHLSRSGFVNAIPVLNLVPLNPTGFEFGTISGKFPNLGFAYGRGHILLIDGNVTNVENCIFTLMSNCKPVGPTGISGGQEQCSKPISMIHFFFNFQSELACI